MRLALALVALFALPAVATAEVRWQLDCKPGAIRTVTLKGAEGAGTYAYMTFTVTNAVGREVPLSLGVWADTDVAKRTYRGTIDPVVQAAVERRTGKKYMTLTQAREKPLADGASVELCFRSNVEGAEHSYRVRRSWSVPANRVNEHLDVFVDGERNDELTELWPEQVERFIPARLSQLYLFDGERIEALADPAQSESALTTAIHALLGVDLISQLQVDLKVLGRRQVKEAVAAPERERIGRLEGELGRARQTLAQLRQEAAGIRSRRDRAVAKVHEWDERFGREGGEHISWRQTREHERLALLERLRAAQGELVALAEGALPFALVRDLLVEIVEQSDCERAAVRAKFLSEELVHRDAQLIAILREGGADKDLVARADSFLAAEREVQERLADADLYLQLTPADESRIGGLLVGGLEDAIRRSRQQVEDLGRVETDLARLDRQLAAVPDEEALAQLVKERERARLKLAELDGALAAFAERIDEVARREVLLARDLDAVFAAAKGIELDARDRERVRTHIDRVSGTLERFRHAILDRHAQRLQRVILEGYRRLLRKQDLLCDLKIDPGTCRLDLFTQGGQRLDSERLSAGERQLLAVSMLWGLGRAAGRALPVVIDTPLGRLDSSHRTNLVDQYFPFASHQVVLLSTDEEIGREHYERLRDRVGHAYRLEHDDHADSTSVERGYFW